MMSTGAAVPRFFVPEPLNAGGAVSLGDEAARHMRVRRLGPGTVVELLDGIGKRATGTLRTLARRNATVDLERVEETAPPAPVHLLVPVADRDRMLWLAEKCAELALTSWRPVTWRRSRSVSPRGEGTGFHAKVRLRMASALEQSGNTWLPATFPDATPDRAMASLPEGPHVSLDAAGASLGGVLTALLREHGASPVTIAVGPEGGFEATELELLDAAGFRRASLGASILRFETAGVVALGCARAALAELESR